ncbi:glutamate synthase large subunit, partial [bacterium]|nr:glutamate synthase large subunit [bacterium]
ACSSLPFDLPEIKKYGVGFLFFSNQKDQQEYAQNLVEQTIQNEGLALLGWRDVPVDNNALGYIAKDSEPIMKQVFVGWGAAIQNQEQFERKLYVIRKLIENEAARHPEQAGYLYIPSFSSKTIVYKGMMLPENLQKYYPDVNNTLMKTGLAIVHQRYSTNTFPTWDLAHPFRFLAHNGEINTLRGNVNWMHAREAMCQSDLFGDDIKKLFPVTTHAASDSAILDNALEFLVMGGRSLSQALMMMIPEAWCDKKSMNVEKEGFYRYHSCLMEPWDGPASVAVTDGEQIGAVLDRNGLRPSRYIVTKDDLCIMASEVGVIEDIPPEDVVLKGRLQPGKCFLIDTNEGRIVGDDEIKHKICGEYPYNEWLNNNAVYLTDLADSKDTSVDTEPLLLRQQAFGYSQEDNKMLIVPMAERGQEPVGSMGNDTPLACVSDRPQLLYNYFKQLFAQVTNPPIDPIREEIIMSLEAYIGREGNLLEQTPEQCRMLNLNQPILTDADLAKIRATHKFKSITLNTLFEAAQGEAGLEKAMQAICQKASQAVAEQADFIILSDRGVNKEMVPIPALLACAGVHHHLIREGTRTRVGLILETGEPREVMHFDLLFGYGAGAINPYLALETVEDLCEKGWIPGIDDKKAAVKNYIKAVGKGLLKTFSKMGISTLQSYRGAQIFEAVGIGQACIDKYFTGTPSRIEGIGADIIAQEALMRHQSAYPKRGKAHPDLEHAGYYQWREGGEHHMVSPEMVAHLQKSVRIKNYDEFKKYCKTVDDENRKRATIRGLLDFQWANESIPLDEVEPAAEIVKRFCTGAMSFGSISKEAHENLAIAMNRLGGKSNTGEGGEDPERFKPLPNGDSKRSAIKQVASGRFGVTIEYLSNSDELQIKMAQGAKPGEGGQLPGHKVNEIIAKVRHSTPGVTLISPPPHHDIYSIEDLAQLIHDLKNSNRNARVSVKLVSEVGVGTVAAGVSKGHSDHVLISGHDGGTGASPLSSIKHAGLPWELGLSETHQVLVKNDLRDRIIVQTDGQMKTGRDVAIAGILGAEEMGFSTAPLIASGCIMMRKCHLNTCPVGVATQHPELRKRFAGKPEHVINYFFFVAEQVREIMAKLGVRKFDDLIGQTQYLKPMKDVNHWKAKTLNLSNILYKPDVPFGVRCTKKQDHGLDKALDNKLLELCSEAIENQNPVIVTLPIRNINRTVGTILSNEIAKRHGLAGLPDNTIHIKFNGSAGQSFGAFLANGVTMELEGDANDYTGKGMSGGRMIVYPSKKSTFVAEENILIGNVVLYGATSGECYFRGVAGERFCVRNSGAWAVVEGVGDHGCEYMTGGRMVCLGPVGRNFGAGMSGGIAFIHDEDGTFKEKCNMSMIDLFPVEQEQDIEELKGMLERHSQYTGSTVAQSILADWENSLKKFIKVFPKEFQRYLREKAEAERQQKSQLEEVVR